MDSEEVIEAELPVDDVFESVKPEMDALRTDELLPIKLDLAAAVTTVLGVLPELRALREQVVKELPAFNLVRFDKLEAYALALAHAHAAFLSATQQPDDLDELVESAVESRETLLAEVKLLVQHGIVNDEPLALLKGAKGYKNIASDLVTLTNVLRATWPRIEGKIFTTAQDLDRAVEASSRLLHIVALRERAPAHIADAMEQRVRAFTLLSRAYEDARRAVAYLRAGTGDADVIAPSLYPGRPRPRKSGADAREPTGADVLDERDAG
jgi:hypothetical protein